jgi:hypothetical protein
MPKKEDRIDKTVSFEKSAKKFKPGPVAKPERDEDRPDMGGGTSEAPDRPDHERAAAAMAHPGPNAEKGLRMSEGAPGKLKRMPGEAEER